MASLGELAAPSLFSSIRCVVLRGLEDLPDDTHDGLLEYATAPSEDIGLILVHSGGQRGSGLLTRLRKLPDRDRGQVGIPEAVGVLAVRVRRGAGPRRPDRRGCRRPARPGRRAGPARVVGRGRSAGQRLPRRAADGGGGAAVLRRPGGGEVVRDRRRRDRRPDGRRPGGAALGARQRHGPDPGDQRLRDRAAWAGAVQVRTPGPAGGRPGAGGGRAAVEDPGAARAGPGVGRPRVGHGHHRGRACRRRRQGGRRRRGVLPGAHGADHHRAHTAADRGSRKASGTQKRRRLPGGVAPRARSYVRATRPSC